MPSVIIESYKTKQHYIYVEVDTSYNGSGVYTTAVCHLWDDDRAGYPIRECTYIDKKKALSTFRRYVREFKNK